MSSSCTVVWVQEPQSETFALATRSSFKELMKGQHQCPYQFLEVLYDNWKVRLTFIYMCDVTCHVSLTGGWSNSDWWRLLFDDCRNIRWRWTEMKGAGCLDSSPVVIVMMRSAAKQACFKPLSLCFVLLIIKCENT